MSECQNADAKVIKKLQKDLGMELKKKVMDAVRKTLFSDPYILATAKELGVQDDGIFELDKKHRLGFILNAAYLDDWKLRHQAYICTNFLPYTKA
ncbi:hypothetical protein BX616_005238 [Lobosporangium transversale]|nr:hypothetical protein BX616_005238 [Lobosporangium transversale]